jgi:hypothetical protein
VLLSEAPPAQRRRRRTRRGVHVLSRVGPEDVIRHLREQQTFLTYDPAAGTLRAGTGEAATNCRIAAPRPRGEGYATLQRLRRYAVLGLYRSDNPRKARYHDRTYRPDLSLGNSIRGGCDDEVASLDQRHCLDILLVHALSGDFSLAPYDQIASLQPPARNSRNERSAQSRHASDCCVPGFGRCSCCLHDSHDYETGPRRTWANCAPRGDSGKKLPAEGTDGVRLEHGVEGAGELACAIPDQELGGSRSLIEVHQEAAGCLGRPGAVGVGGDAGQVNAAGAGLHHDQPHITSSGMLQERLLRHVRVSASGRLRTRS